MSTLHTGTLGDLVGIGPSFGFDSDYFPNGKNQGFFFSMIYEVRKDPILALIQQKTGVTLSGDSCLESGFISIGYVYRNRFFKNWGFSFGAGPGIYSIGFSITNNEALSKGSAFALTQNLGLTWWFGLDRSAFQPGELGLTLKAYNAFISQEISTRSNSREGRSAGH